MRSPRPQPEPARGEDWRPRPGQRTSILFDVFALAQSTRTLLQAAMRDAGLKPDEYATYSVVFEQGPVTLTEMARELHMPVTTVADYVRAMLRRGHLRKDVHPTDQRSYLLALTSTGRRAHQKANQSFERAYLALLDELGDLDEGHARAVLQALAASTDRALAGLSTDRKDAAADRIPAGHQVD